MTEPSALDDALDTLPNVIPIRGCAVCWVIGQLPEPSAAKLRAALGNELKSTKGIGTALRSAGYPVKDGTVGRHRRGDCVGAG